MAAKILAVITCICILLSLAGPVFAISEAISQNIQLDELNLPSALADDDSFNELPFEQLRQALREEVERDPTKEFKKPPPEKYNLLIR
tara:strand:- start:8 stop:271 length:264 start_codon:yes stop_codon:yes gene_type:complete